MKLDREIQWQAGRALSGFTLLELLITVAIISILTALATTNYLTALPKMRARDAARQIWSDIHVARSQAVKAKQDVVIIFYPAGNIYSIVIDVGHNMGPDSAGKYCVVDLEGADKDKYIVQNKHLPEGIVFANGIGLPPTVDGEPMGDGVRLANKCVFFQSSGRASNGNSDQSGDALSANSNRSVYVIPLEYLQKNNFNAFFGVVIEGISGLPKVKKYIPEGHKWED